MRGRGKRRRSQFEKEEVWGHRQDVLLLLLLLLWLGIMVLELVCCCVFVLGRGNEA